MAKDNGAGNIRDKSLRFYPKALFVFTFGLLITLADVVYWQSARPLLMNLLVVGSAMFISFAIFLGFLKRVNAAKLAVYVLLLFLIVGALGVTQRPLQQQGVLYAHIAIHLIAIVLLIFNREQAREYFKNKGLNTWWKVAYGIVFVLITVTTIAGVTYQKYLQAESKAIAGGLETSLVMEGDASPAAVATCKEKYKEASVDLNEDQLQRFCTCVVLNVEVMMKNTDPTKSTSGLLSQYMAIGDACMARIR